MSLCSKHLYVFSQPPSPAARQSGALTPCEVAAKRNNAPSSEYSPSTMRRRACTEPRLVFRGKRTLAGLQKATNETGVKRGVRPKRADAAFVARQFVASKSCLGADNIPSVMTEDRSATQQLQAIFARAKTPQDWVRFARVLKAPLHSPKAYEVHGSTASAYPSPMLPPKLSLPCVLASTRRTPLSGPGASSSCSRGRPASNHCRAGGFGPIRSFRERTTHHSLIKIPIAADDVRTEGLTAERVHVEQSPTPLLRTALDPR